MRLLKGSRTGSARDHQDDGLASEASRGRHRPPPGAGGAGAMQGATSRQTADAGPNRYGGECADSTNCQRRYGHIGFHRRPRGVDGGKFCALCALPFRNLEAVCSFEE